MPPVSADQVDADNVKYHIDCEDYRTLRPPSPPPSISAPPPSLLITHSSNERRAEYKVCK